MLARKAQAQGGGTLGEYLVLGGFIDDDELTEFYSGKLLIPRIDPSEMSRIPSGVLRKIPADMAAEFRVVPIATDGDQNLTLAMSDPADVHAVEEVGFFSGSYVVRAAATQLQIAWCLAHYYGVVTPLAQARLLGGGPDGDSGDRDDAGVAATPELVIEAETGPTRAARPATLRGAEPEELMPRSGELDGRGPAPEPDKLPAVVVEDEPDEDDSEAEADDGRRTATGTASVQATAASSPSCSSARSPPAAGRGTPATAGVARSCCWRRSRPAEDVHLGRPNRESGSSER